MANIPWSIKFVLFVLLVTTRNVSTARDVDTASRLAATRVKIVKANVTQITWAEEIAAITAIPLGHMEMCLVLILGLVVSVSMAACERNMHHKACIDDSLSIATGKVEEKARGEADGKDKETKNILPHYRGSRHDADDTNPQERTNKAYSTRELFSSLFSLVSLWLNQESSRWTARMCLLCLTVAWIWREFVWAFVTSAFHNDFTNKITSLHDHKDMDRVYKAFILVLAVDILVSLPTFSIMYPLIDYYAKIRFRDFLTERILTKYIKESGNAYYHVKMNERAYGIDNPDQRIVEDAANISGQCMTLWGSLLSSTIGATMWSSVIFGVGGKHMVQISFFSCIARTVIAWLGFSSSIVEARKRLLQTPAEMRYGLTRIRDSAEELALGFGNEREYHRVSGLYSAITASIWNFTAVELRYQVSMGIFDKIPGVCLWVCMFPRIMSGELGYGDAMRVFLGYDQISKVFGFFVNNMELLADIQANAERFHRLGCACEDSNKSKNVVDSTRMEEASSDVALQIDNVVIHTGGLDATSKIGDVCLRCPVGQSLLISGPSGCGKTSLLRCVAGLWQQGTGCIKRPGGTSTSFFEFMPTRCYMPIGSLHQLVCYPCVVDGDEQSAKHALQRAHLEYLVDRWGLRTELDWRPLLSTGEQQRLAFARLFWRVRSNQANSILLMLDEATSALDVKVEFALYTELRKELQEGRSLRGFVSVAHRPQLRALHDTWLFLGDQAALPTEETLCASVLASGTWLAPEGQEMYWQQLIRSDPLQQETLHQLVRQEDVEP